MLRIPYTIEMQKQDKLHDKEKEDYNTMYILHRYIIKQAREQGFDGIDITEFSEEGYEYLTTLFGNARHQEFVSSGKMDIDSYAKCKDLIVALNEFTTKYYSNTNLRNAL